MTNVNLIQPKLFNLNKVLKFWFNECKPRQWFVKDKKFDLIINKRFYNLVCEALENKLDDWTVNRDGSVALILLLDQFTRNIFRGSPKSFSGDEKALNITFQFLKSWRIEDLDKRKRQFLLMPMMHSEDINIQENINLSFVCELDKKIIKNSKYNYLTTNNNGKSLSRRRKHSGNTSINWLSLIHI